MVENSETILSSDWIRETLEAYDRGVAPFNDDSEARDLQAELAEFIASEIEEGIEDGKEEDETATIAKLNKEVVEALDEWFSETELGFVLQIKGGATVTLPLPDALLNQISAKVADLIGFEE